MKIGCHVSIAGGFENAPLRAKALGCETFQIFSRSPRGGKAAPITSETVEKFSAAMRQTGIKDFVIHTPYYINFGSPKNNIYHGSVAIVRDELERGSKLGARFVMTHLGSFNGTEKTLGMPKVIKGLEKVLGGYVGSTQLLIEIAAGAGEVIGSNFEQLAKFVGALKKYRGFGGICFDTQHAFASGYDLRDAKSIAATFKEFDQAVGLKYLRMSHVNDSKPELGAKKDRHDHIGAGKIGRPGFKAFFKFIGTLEQKNKAELLLILETEHDKVVADIKLLKSLRA